MFEDWRSGKKELKNCWKYIKFKEVNHKKSKALSLLINWIIFKTFCVEIHLNDASNKNEPCNLKQALIIFRVNTKN